VASKAIDRSTLLAELVISIAVIAWPRHFKPYYLALPADIVNTQLPSRGNPADCLIRLTFAMFVCLSALSLQGVAAVLATTCLWLGEPQMWAESACSAVFASASNRAWLPCEAAWWGPGNRISICQRLGACCSLAAHSCRISTAPSCWRLPSSLTKSSTTKSPDLPHKSIAIDLLQIYLFFIKNIPIFHFSDRKNLFPRRFWTPESSNSIILSSQNNDFWCFYW